MKKLLLIALLAVSTASFGACNIELGVKKAGAKTAYVNGVSVSGKIQEALEASGCVITKKVLTEQETKDMTIKALETRLAKLKK